MKLYSPRLIIALMLMAVLLLIFNIASSISVGQYNCQQINSLKVYNFQSIQRAEKSLPTISYYKRHPEELVQQEQLLKDAAAHNQPTHCASIFNPFPK